ncbi:MAG TPA: lysylphosphatidylglycerol synthase domain-containing protein [Gammaproteobacteria bacterium]|nr:lysylphosphatidylglycerol synthase domain-containing protein [Gammaproteobacteria bacterium]
MRAKLIAWAAGLIGLLLAIALVVMAGSGDILHVLEIAGWGLFWLGPLHIVPVLLDALAFRALLRTRPDAPSLPYVFWVSAVREGVNNLLPVARVGGELAGIRLLHKRGIPIALGGACVILLLTLTAIGLYLLTLAGLGLLLSNIPGAKIAGPAGVVLLAMLPGMALMVAAQRYGNVFERLDRLIEIVTGGHKLLARWVQPTELDAEIRQFYGRLGLLAVSGTWKFLSLAAEAAEVWVIMYLLHHPVAVWQAIVMETMSLAARGAAFIVPAGVGVQEGSFVLIGQLVGVPADFAIAISLAKRFRELLFGVPSILSWQWREGRQLGKVWRTEQSDSNSD